MTALHKPPLARILDHEADYWTTIAAVSPRDGFYCVHNAALPARFDPNHAGGFRGAPGTGARIAADMLNFFQSCGENPAAFVDLLATPDDLVPALEAAGLREEPLWASDLMLFIGPDSERPSPVEVIRVESAAERHEWASLIEEEASGQTYTILYDLYLAEIIDSRVTAYLARIDGVAAGRALLFSSNGLGRVEAVRTQLPYRGHGVASALVRSAVTDSLLNNALTYIYAEPGGAAQRLYHRLGFRTIAERVMRVFLYAGDRG